MQRKCIQFSTEKKIEVKNQESKLQTNFKMEHVEEPSSGSSPVNPVEECGCVRVGKCKWFNVAKGWGFLTPNDGGQEVFVHQSVIQMSGFRSLGEQEEVEFECQRTERGLEATRVSGRQGESCHGSTYRPRMNRKTRRMRCYNCGEFANHIASECAQGPQPKRCHRCRSEDHLHADCPHRNVTQTQSSKSLPSEEVAEEAP